LTSQALENGAAVLPSEAEYSGGSKAESCHVRLRTAFHFAAACADMHGRAGFGWRVSPRWEDVASRSSTNPICSAGMRTAPRLDASAAFDATTGWPGASAIICSHTLERRSAPPEAITCAGAGNERLSSARICLNDIATPSRQACRMSEGLLARLIPAITARRSGRQ